MTLQDFFERYKGVEVDFDNMYGAQCVDLTRFGWSKIFGVPRALQPATTPSGGAKDLINNVKKPFTVVKEPQVGDAVVMGATRGNPWGHTGIVSEVNDGNIVIMEQDGLNQGRGAYFKVYPINHPGILGYIRYVG